MENVNRSRTKPAVEKSGKEKEATPKTTRGKNTPVTFNVTVPDVQGKPPKAVYLTGNFQQLGSNLSNWDPKGLKMKKVSAKQWSITIKGQSQTDIEYKYTLGSWDQVETDAHGRDTMNRHAALNQDTPDGLTLDDTVQSWRNR